MLVFSYLNVKELWQKCITSKIYGHSEKLPWGSLRSCSVQAAPLLTTGNGLSCEMWDCLAVSVRWDGTVSCMWHRRGESMEDGSTRGEIKSWWSQLILIRCLFQNWCKVNWLPLSSTHLLWQGSGLAGSLLVAWCYPDHWRCWHLSVWFWVKENLWVWISPNSWSKCCFPDSHRQGWR